MQKYQALASSIVPNAINQKSVELQNSMDQNFWQELTGKDDWQIQELNEASETVVNMDSFPININQLPSFVLILKI